MAQGHEERIFTVHFDKKLVQCIFSFVVGSLKLALTTCATNSIYLIDEDDARCMLLCLGKETTHLKVHIASSVVAIT